MANSFLRKYPLPLLLSTLLTVMPLVTSSLFTGWAITHESSITGWTLMQWVGLTGALAVASALALVPPGFLALVYGYILGWISLPLLFAMNIVAIAMVYFLARYLKANEMLLYLEQAFPSAKTILTRFRENQLKLIFFTKLSPVLPFAVTNLLFALAGASLRRMLLGGALGMVPRTILTVWAGTKAKEIRYLLEHPNEGLATQVLLLALLLISTVGIGWFFKPKK
ncbi:TVP38/TMEM64 family protein [Telluribacter sp. SYSU D00476]|uniref:TVP38/TMEM64 family protein n=1 Tax=Telluribacter sp. SYSU D00476 TaxID=2811430 RepID=UPI001FF298B6|nr:VTT domain-containing protein [Telluribacter sp. SYSU D00476]